MKQKQVYTQSKSADADYIPFLLYTLILGPCIFTGLKYAIFFHIAYFDITYFRAFFTFVAMYGTILHPAFH